MEAFQTETNTISEALATWNRPRTDEEIQDFLSRHAVMFDETELV